MTLLYNFYNYPIDGKLYMEIWREMPENEQTGIKYLWTVQVENIGHGFMVLEKYREGGHIVKQSGF